MKRNSKAFGSFLGLAVLPLLLSCSDPLGLEEEKSDTEQVPELINQRPMTVVIHPGALEIEVGQTIRLRAVLYAADGEVLDNDFPVRWSSSRPERVLMTDDGFATGLALGSSRITAHSGLDDDWMYLRVLRKASGRDNPDDEDEKELADEVGADSGDEHRK